MLKQHVLKIKKVSTDLVRLKNHGILVNTCTMCRQPRTFFEKRVSGRKTPLYHTIMYVDKTLTDY
jgi:hypothetical protein